MESVMTEQIKVLVGSWGREQKKFKERFLTLQRNTLVPVVAESIAYFHKVELIFIYTNDNEKMIGEHQTLDEIESLIDSEKFFRVNRQYIVHIQSVAGVKTDT